MLRVSKNIKTAAVIAICSVIAALIFFDKGVKEYSNDFYSMNTFVSETTYGAECKETGELLKRLDSLFSMHSADSEIYKINENAGAEPIAVSDETIKLLTLSMKYSSEYFDITAGAITRAWGVSSDSPKVPSDGDIDAALSLTGTDKLVINENTVYLTERGAAIDLGGIAKGYACDRLRELYAKNEKITGAVVSFGSSILLYGKKPDGSFKIAVRNPFDSTKTIGTLTLSECFISTSGGYERYFEAGGEKYHHIFDLRTGRPADNGLASVTVITDSGALGDCLSTEIFVAGTEKIDEYLNKYKVLAIGENGEIYISYSLKESFSLTDPSFKAVE